jgi:hypothetical protein
VVVDSLEDLRKVAIQRLEIELSAPVDASEFRALPDQSSGRAAKSRLVFLYHAIPDTGFFHLPFISFKALSCVSSPPATISFKCVSCAFITSSAVFPRSGKSHGPPNCLHVIVFMSLASFVVFGRQLGLNQA